jgi:histidinol dehydrogenase
MKLIQTFGDTRDQAEALLREIEYRGDTNIAKVADTVAEILAAIRTRGDAALLDLATRLDGFSGQSVAGLRVSREEMQIAWDTIPDDLKAAMLVAQANIRAFAERQLPKSWSAQPALGIETGQVVRPLASVGCYVPGGRYPLPSTLLMTTTPAQVAGVPRIAVCSPRPALETLAAAHLAGVTEFYRIGGAQAVAALAFGTETIARVDKIVGPGNLFVTAAKLAVSTVCGIDMPAGPTEIVVTSETGSPRGIAADLVAQAEHDPEALAILLTSNMQLAEAVRREADLQSAANPIAQQSLAAQGFIFITESVTEAQTLTNRLAPEHLSVDDGADVRWIQNAGSVFIGQHTPQSLGDYISGPNHVLPTGRNGRVRGGLSVLDFVKIITVQRYTRDGLATVAPHAIRLAEAEGLTAHADSVRVKLETE